MKKSGFATFLLVAATLVVISFPSFECTYLAYGSSGDKAKTDETTEKISPERLFEAVSGYLEGFHRPATKEGQAHRDPWKYRPLDSNTIQIKDAERLVESELTLSQERLQRREWDNAVLSLQRVAAAGHGSSTIDNLLQTAKQKASDPAARTPGTPGEMINSVGIRLILIKSGTFTMGSSPSEIRRLQTEWNVPEAQVVVEGPEHKVRISRGFYMGKYPVTVGEFKRFVAETGFSTVAEKQGWGWAYDDAKKHWSKKSGASWRNTGTKLQDDHPVTFIAYTDAEAFCEWLSKKDGRKYYLPTEAQWEYSARGGKEGLRYPWGNNYPDGNEFNIADKRSELPWADRTIDDLHARTSPVGFYNPNTFWLYDMVGNVWQFCSDIYDTKSYEQATVTDPAGPKSGKKRVVRGGNWAFDAGIARNAFRFGVDPDLCTDFTGFRIAAIADFAEELHKPETVLSNESADMMLHNVKDLVGSGKRLEAIKSIDNFSRSKTVGTIPDQKYFTTEALRSLVDVTRDKTYQNFVNSLNMKMVRIPAGSFLMGSSEADISWAMQTLGQGQPINLEMEYPAHKVRVSRPFYISATEVTVGQFRAFVEDTGYITDAEDDKGGQVFNASSRRFEKKAGSSWRNPGWQISDDQPVVMVSYNDAVAFVEWLTAKEKLPYKLPTEAQWEYASRGGIPAAQFPWGDELPDGKRANYADKNTDYEWRDRNSDDGYKYVSPVGSYEANGYGLYDMAGNALEWCRDYYSEDYYKFTPDIDPEGPGHGEYRVMKGGEWTFGPVNLRNAFRGWSRPDLAVFNGGFRVAIETQNVQRPFHFSNDFLTKEWVPGADQRAVATAVAKEQEFREKTATKKDNREPAEDEDLSVKGIVVLDFSPRSDAKKAGMQKGDVIIEYNGTADLTVDKFIALTSVTRRDKAKPLITFVRNGTEYSIRINPGFLGVSVMNTVARGPFKKPAVQPDSLPETEKDKKSKSLDWT